jgi:DNA-binding CsgD family transcriptional regulator
MVNKGMKVFSDFNPVPVNKADPDKTFFSPREKQVLGMIIDGYTTKEISMHLSLSTFTVDSHRKSINRKTNSTSKTQLIAWVKENNFYMV